MNIHKHLKEPICVLNEYARRAGHKKYNDRPWMKYLIKRIWNKNNLYGKSLGGE